MFHICDAEALGSAQTESADEMSNILISYYSYYNLPGNTISLKRARPG